MSIGSTADEGSVKTDEQKVVIGGSSSDSLRPPIKNRGSVLSKTVLLGCLAALSFSSCSLFPHTKGRHAFISYWPPDPKSDRLRVAVKDNIDFKGVVTTAGSEYLLKNNPPAKKDAPCLAIARQRNVQFVGKANLSEFAVAPSGFNEYFGTPENPYSSWRKFIPGGSSCGSAVSVANNRADIAFGTDTAGSVRVPAACCGIVGLKTTFGLVPLGGVYPIEAQHLDTIGPLGKNIERTVQGMALLQGGFEGKYEAAKAAHPSAAGIRVGRLRVKGTSSEIDAAVDRALAETGFKVVELPADLAEKWEQAKKDGNTIAAAGAWISDQKYADKLGISLRTKTAILVGKIAYETGYWPAVARQKEWQKTLKQVFQKVDVIALPTLQSTPPLLPPNLKIGLLEALMLDRQNTVAVNFAGNPALAMPVPLKHGEVPVTSLQLIGPRLSEAQLLNAGRLVEVAVRKR